MVSNRPTHHAKGKRPESRGPLFRSPQGNPASSPHARPDIRRARQELIISPWHRQTGVSSPPCSCRISRICPAEVTLSMGGVHLFAHATPRSKRGGAPNLIRRQGLKIRLDSHLWKHGGWDQDHEIACSASEEGLCFSIPKMTLYVLLGLFHQSPFPSCKCRKMSASSGL